MQALKRKRKHKRKDYSPNGAKRIDSGSTVQGRSVLVVKKYEVEIQMLEKWEKKAFFLHSDLLTTISASFITTAATAASGAS